MQSSLTNGHEVDWLLKQTSGHSGPVASESSVQLPFHWLAVLPERIGSSKFYLNPDAAWITHQKVTGEKRPVAGSM
ncbi:hypothetical protein PCAR4_570172 [Paraburkholderia caribensis]|nr:hypothetical protein PCAR4_570172 [Paraburkholderia caribensis]